MVFTIIIAFVSLIGLMILHEFGHFVVAKRFGVKVEEFGIGYPPRLFGKRIGETIYSLNLLPFGAFVKIYGEEKKVDELRSSSPFANARVIEDSRSFSQKPIWQRAFIVLGGVVSFWIISAILLSIVMGLGTPAIISDEENGGLVNPRVQIAAVAPGSPAEKAELEAGDTIKKIIINPEQILPELYGAGSQQLTINTVKEVQEFTNLYRGKEVTLTIERGKEVFETSLVPRVSPPDGEGAMGVALVRTAIKSYPWYEAPFRGILATGNLTIAVIQGWAQALGNLIKGLPTGVQLMGPVGIFSLFAQAGQLGVIYFLQFIAIISIYIALFNILPIPALDGGKLLFLGIEAVRRKPVSQKIEQNITVAFFMILIALMVLVTIKDVVRLF
ncbi:MAG: site-2 protease family protein [Candidatus Pacebacteria bacterium]|nr:site-2 protease family protein [Candidatus Paceibacterota bacterium]